MRDAGEMWGRFAVMALLVALLILLQWLGCIEGPPNR